MKPALSKRSRNLSQRRRDRAEGVDLSGQDSSMKDRDSWVAADSHREYADDDEEEEEEEALPATTETRGRDEERVAEA